MPGQRPAWAQLLGLVEPATGFAGRDPPPDRQHVAPGLGAHFLGRGLGLQPGQEAVALRRKLAGQGLEFVADGQHRVKRQCIQSRCGDLGVAGAHHRDALVRLRHDSHIYTAYLLKWTPVLEVAKYVVVQQVIVFEIVC